jgi:hypothetical protein
MLFGALMNSLDGAGRKPLGTGSLEGRGSREADCSAIAARLFTKFERVSF